jgi:hypothetical protein
MRRFLTNAVLCLALLTGCNVPVAATGPFGDTFQPGLRLIPNPYPWNTKATSAEGKALFKSFESPEAVSDWMQANLEWRDDYDTSYFLAPQEVLDTKRAVCSGLARVSREALLTQGFNATLIAFWGLESAHAVTIFLDKTGHYRLFSNQFYTPLNDLGTTLDQALVKAAEAFYGSSWRRVAVYEEGGIVTQQVINEKLSGPLPALPVNGITARNIFRIRGR